MYAGAVGRFDFNENELDTCIAIRTMTFKDGVAYLQAGKQAYREPRVMSWFLTPQRIAGGGIVFDSVEEDEYIETINKLGANVRCIDAAEGKYQSFSKLRISPDMLALQNITPRWSAPHKIGYVLRFHRHTTPYAWSSSPLTLTHDPFFCLSVLLFRLLDHIRRQAHAVDGLLAIGDQPIPKVLLVERVLRLAFFICRRGPVSRRVGSEDFVDEDELGLAVGF